MPTRNDSEQADILVAVKARLQDQIPELGELNCFVSILPDGDPYRPADNLFVTVAPTGGTFEGIAGGGARQCTENTGVLVTIFSRFRAQRQERDEDALVDEVRGILRMKRAILRALAGHDLYVSTDPLQPAAPALRAYLAPTESSPPDPTGDREMVMVSLRFDVTFDWDLA